MPLNAHDAARYAATQSRHTPLRIGMTWNGSNGKVWEIIEYLYFGRWLVRTTDRTRVGEMYSSGIRAALAADRSATPCP